jgi:primosomal protein N'
MAMLTLKGRNEDKVKFAAGHLKKAIESVTKEMKDLIIKGPAPAPLLRAESYYRYQMTLLSRQMSLLSANLSRLNETLTLPEDVTLSVDIDPTDMG